MADGARRGLSDVRRADGEMAGEAMDRIAVSLAAHTAGKVAPRLACDVHTHTLFSRHAYSTIEENVRMAAERGLELVGSTDHYSAMLYPEVDGLPHVRDFQYFMNYSCWPREWHGVRVLHGCEADIVGLGGELFGHDVPLERGITSMAFHAPITLKELVFSDCDYVIASVHNRDFAAGASPAAGAAMYVGALEDPKVLILGHIGRAGVPFEIDPVLTAARDLGKLIEINEHSLAARPESRDVCRHVAERCAELGTMISVGSDAHIACELGSFPCTRALLAEIGFPEHLVATRSADAFMGVLHAALG